MPRGRSRLVPAGWPRPVPAGLAAFAVVLQLSATVGGAIHLALVRHERCPEHGEWIHTDGDRHAGAEPALSRRAARSHDLARALAPDPTGAHDSHDPCSILGLARQRSIVPASASIPVPLAATAAPSTCLPRAVAGARLAAYRLAPKTSRPIAAAV